MYTQCGCACRSDTASVFSKSILTNKLLVAGIIFEILLLSAVTCLPALQKIFGTYFVDLRVLGFACFCSITILCVDELRKLAARQPFMW